MATRAMRIKAARKPKFMTRTVRRCRVCGRPRSVLRKFALCRICDSHNIPVLAYGLRTDFQAELFEGSKWLLALADSLNEIKAVCGCGRKSTMNLRVDAAGRVAREGEQTQIGGNDSYIAMCRRHFIAAMRDGVLPDYR